MDNEDPMKRIHTRGSPGEAKFLSIIVTMGATEAWIVIMFLAYVLATGDEAVGSSALLFLVMLSFGALTLSGLAFSFIRDARETLKGVQVEKQGLVAYGSRIEWGEIKVILTDEGVEYFLLVFDDISKEGSAMKVLKRDVPSPASFLKMARANGVEVVEEVPTPDSARRKLSQLGLDKDWRE